MGRAVVLRSESPPILSRIGQGPATEIPAHLYLPPDADGPAPAVLLAHGLGGVLAAREHHYVRDLTAAGYAVLLYDSFAARRRSRWPDLLRALTVTEGMLVADAFAGLRLLQAMPGEIDPERVAIFGFSYGGMISVLCAYEAVASRYAVEGGRFAAHVGFYGCTIPRLADPRTSGAPVYLAFGREDANASLSRAERIADDLRAGGSPVDLEFLDGACHQWDGADIRPRHVPFHLGDTAFEVDAALAVRDPASGIGMKSRVSRALMLALRVRPSGYWMHAVPALRAHTDRRLAHFLARSLAARSDRNQARAG